MKKLIVSKHRLVSLLCLFAIFPYLFLYYYNIPEAFYFSFASIVLCSFILWNDKCLTVCYVEINKVNVVSFIMAILFVIMLSLSQIIAFILNIGESVPIVNESLKQFSGLIYQVWSFFVYLPILVISSYVGIRTLFELGMKNGTNTDEKINWYTRVSINQLFLMICAVSIICLLSTYPGAVVAPDVVGVWSQIEGVSPMSDWHSVGYMYFVYICSKLLHSQYSVIIVQTIVWILVNRMVLKYFERVDQSRRMAVFYTLASILVFTPYAYLQMMLKDVIFGVVFLGMTVSILTFINQEVRWKDCGIAIILCYGVVHFRHGQIITFLISYSILLLWSLLNKHRKKSLQIVTILLCTLVCYVSVRTFAFNVQNVQKNPKYVTYTVPVSMVGAAVANGVEFSEEEVALLEEVMPVEKWGECYDKYLLDGISRSWGEIADDVYILEEKIENEGYGSEIIKLNARLVLTHPVIYLTAFFDANSIVWEIGMPTDSYTQGIQTYTEDPGSTKYLMMWGITSKLIKLGRELPVINDICTRGGVHIFGLFICCIMLVFKRRKSEIIAVIPILVFNGLYLLTIPAQQTRYILVTIECALFIFSYVFFCNDRNVQLQEI